MLAAGPSIVGEEKVEQEDREKRVVNQRSAGTKEYGIGASAMMPLIYFCTYGKIDDLQWIPCLVHVSGNAQPPCPPSLQVEFKVDPSKGVNDCKLPCGCDFSRQKRKQAQKTQRDQVIKVAGLHKKVDLSEQKNVRGATKSGAGDYMGDGCLSLLRCGDSDIVCCGNSDLSS